MAEPKMHWDCEKDGCFNKFMRLHSEHLKEPFERAGIKNGHMGDIDGCVEVGGRLLWIEKKAGQIRLPVGQERMFKALSKTVVTVFVITWINASDPDTITGMSIWFRGKEYVLRPPITITHLNGWIHIWLLWAKSKFGEPVMVQEDSQDQALDKSMIARLEELSAIKADSEHIDLGSLLSNF